MLLTNEVRIQITFTQKKQIINIFRQFILSVKHNKKPV
jgi:hypothetical protein